MKAEVDKNEHVGAPMKGEVVVVKVQPGDVVEAGQVVKKFKIVSFVY